MQVYGGVSGSPLGSLLCYNFFATTGCNDDCAVCVVLVT